MTPDVAAGADRWQEALAGAIRDPDELVDALGLPETFREPARRAAARFGLVVPRSFVARMRPGDPDDPLLRQVLPVGAELEPVPGYVADPVDDRGARVVGGLLRKYAGRALVVAAGACAVNCRYCFRREFDYGDAPAGRTAWEAVGRALAADRTLGEVILSGGDPLVLSDRLLEGRIADLAAIDHLRLLRVHTRLPIVLPARVTDRLVAVLRSTRLVPRVVVHANHPAELEGDCPAALARLVDGGIPVLNQSVLLAGVNDDLEVLVDLSNRLVELRVTPYYLHQLDPVRGGHSFHVPESTGRALVEGLRARLPGHAVPRYVREDPGAASKTPLA